MANICSYWQTNTVKWKPFHCHLEAHHGTSVVLRTCVWQTASQLWLLTFHTGVSCEHNDVVDVDFIVAYGRMHWQITTDRHVTSSQSLTFPIPLRWHKTLTGPRNKSLSNHRKKKRRDVHTSSFAHKLYPQNNFNSWNDTTGVSFNAASLSLSPSLSPSPSLSLSLTPVILLSIELWKEEVKSGARHKFSKCVSAWFWTRNSSALTARCYMSRVYKPQPAGRIMQPAATFVNQVHTVRISK